MCCATRRKSVWKRANMLLNATLANMPHGVCMFGATKTRSGQRLYSTMYGLDAKGVTPGTTLPQILESRVASGCSRKTHRNTLRAAWARRFARTPATCVDQLKDGRTLAVSRRPMPDGGSVAVHQDITAHLRAEKELEKTKAVSELDYRNIPIAVVVKDANTRKFVLVNRAFEAMLKVPRSEVIGKNGLRNLPVERMPNGSTRQTTRRWQMNSARIPTIMKSKCLHGDSRILATNRIVARDSQGVARHLIVVMDDVTERKKSEQRIAFMAHHDV